MMYGNSLSKALIDQFPEVNFDTSKFNTMGNLFIDLVLFLLH